MSDAQNILLGRDPGWYVVNQSGPSVMRGPYKHQETAVEVRREIEHRATDRQMELWNLLVCQPPKPKRKQA